MNYDVVTLGDVCEFLDSQRVPITESDRKPGPYPYYGANGQQDSIDSYIFDEPLVLLAEDGGYFGSKERPIAYKVTGKCWVNNHAHVLRPKSNIDVNYLHRVLSYYDVTKYVNGTTRQKLTKGNAENISFPLPPLTEQKRIASLLARADRLRSLRRTARDLGESLLQSVFLEMFGEPIKNNPNGYEICELKDVCNRITDGTHQPPEWAENGIPFLFVSNVIDGELTFDTQKFISEKTWYELQKRCPIELNDILYTIVGSYGNAALVKTTRKFSFQRHIAHVKPNPKKICPVFLLGMMQSIMFREQVEQQVRGVAQKTLNLGELQEIKVFVPPLNLQKEFASVVRRVEQMRARQAEGERQAQGLFESLLALSFVEGLAESFG